MTRSGPERPVVVDVAVAVPGPREHWHRRLPNDRVWFRVLLLTIFLLLLSLLIEEIGRCRDRWIVFVPVCALLYLISHVKDFTYCFGKTLKRARIFTSNFRVETIATYEFAVRIP